MSCYLLQNIKGIFAVFKTEHIKFFEKCYGDEFEYQNYYQKNKKMLTRLLQKQFLSDWVRRN